MRTLAVVAALCVHCGSPPSPGSDASQGADASPHADASSDVTPDASAAYIASLAGGWVRSTTLSSPSGTLDVTLGFLFDRTAMYHPTFESSSCAYRYQIRMRWEALADGTLAIEETGCDRFRRSPTCPAGVGECPAPGAPMWRGVYSALVTGTTLRIGRSPVDAVEYRRP